ncbi:MAG: nucleotide-binding protein [Acidimicrobiales bacterium]
MRLGVAGKGGVGKTTISAVLARSLARRGYRVVAIDCDSDPNLAANVGLSPDEVSSMRPILDQSGPLWTLPAGADPASVVERYGHTGPDDVTLMLAARAEKAGSG